MLSQQSARGYRPDALPIEEDDEEVPPEALEPLEDLSSAQEHDVDGEDEGVFTSSFCALVCSGQLQLALGSDEPPAEALPFTSELPDSVVKDGSLALGFTLTLLSVLVCAKAAPSAPSMLQL